MGRVRGPCASGLATDLLGIVHPDYPYKGPTRWFRHLSVNAQVIIVTEAACTGNLSEPLALVGTACTVVEEDPVEPSPPIGSGAVVAIVIVCIFVVGALAAYLVVRLIRSRRDANERAPLFAESDHE